MNWGYIRGLFDGDGTACACKHKSYKSGLRGYYAFYSNSREFLVNVRSFIDDNLGTNGKIYEYDGPSYKLHYVRHADTILIGLELLAGYFHKRDAVERVMSANGWHDSYLLEINNITSDYIRGFFDADGSVFCNARGIVVVAFFNKRLQILTDIRKFFNMRNKITILTNTNKEPDYVLSVIAKEKTIEILEILRDGCMYKYDGIVEGLYWLRKTYKNRYKRWLAWQLDAIKNKELDVRVLSRVVEKSPLAIAEKQKELGFS